MAHSENENLNSIPSRDDFEAIEFPEVDRAFLASIWEENQKAQDSNGERLANFIKSLEEDISIDGLDSFENCEPSFSSVEGLVVDDQNTLSVDDYKIDIDVASYFSPRDEITNWIEDLDEEDHRMDGVVECGGDGNELNSEKGQGSDDRDAEDHRRDDVMECGGDGSELDLEKGQGSHS